MSDYHNKKLINKLDWNNNGYLRHSCYCKIKNEFPLRNKCNLDNIMYQANILPKENDKAYISMRRLNWKFRYYNHLQSGVAVRVFANGPGDLGSISGRVIPKTQKMVLDASLLNTQHYKVRIKGKVEQSWERSSPLPYTLV